MTACPKLPSPPELTLLTDEEFAARWCMLVGEPPAVMLPDRAEMIRLLVECMTPAKGALKAEKGLNTEPEPKGEEAADR